MINNFTISPSKKYDKSNSKAPQYVISFQNSEGEWERAGVAWAKKDKAGKTFLSASLNKEYKNEETGKVYPPFFLVKGKAGETAESPKTEEPKKEEPKDEDEDWLNQW